MEKVDPQRIKSIEKITLSALMVCAALAVTDSVNAESGGADPLASSHQIVDAVREANSRTQAYLRSERQSTTAPVSLREVGSDGCFMDLVETADEGSDSPHADSSVMLAITYVENKKIYTGQGSGTIIRGPDGLRSILTAAHVIDPTLEKGVLQSIIAYDRHGYAIGDFQTTFLGEDEFEHLAGRSDRIFGDIAVLHAKELFGEIGSSIYEKGGLEIAPLQPDRILSALPDTEGNRGFAISGGVSGASIVNDAGQVIGIVAQKLKVSCDELPLTRHAYPERLQNPHNMSYLSSDALQTMQTLQRTSYETEGFDDAIGIALPIVNDLALYDMGYDAKTIEIGSAVEEYARAQIAGYPSTSCQTSEVVLTQMPEIHVTRDTQAKWARVLPHPVTVISDPYFEAPETAVQNPFKPTPEVDLGTIYVQADDSRLDQ